MTKALQIAALEAITFCLSVIRNPKTRPEDNAIWSAGTSSKPRITEEVLETCLTALSRMEQAQGKVDITAWPRVTSRWEGENLIWTIESVDVSDKVLRSWCFHNLEHTHDRHVDVVRHFHIVAWAKANVTQPIQSPAQEMPGTMYIRENIDGTFDVAETMLDSAYRPYHTQPIQSPDFAAERLSDIDRLEKATGLTVEDALRKLARRSPVNQELLEACQSAYGQMLQMPHDMLRLKSQKTLVMLRDAIANAKDLTPEYVQNSYEQAITDAVIAHAEQEGQKS